MNPFGNRWQGPGNPCMPARGQPSLKMAGSREETTARVDRIVPPYRRRWMKRVRDRLRGDLRLTITTLCVVFATIWILPFSVYRFATGDVRAGLLDLLIVLGIAIPASHALLTGRSELGIRIIALVCCFGCVAAAEVLGLVGLLWSYALLIFVFFVLPRNTAVMMSLATLVAIAIVADGALASTFEQVSFLASAALVALFAHVVATRYELQRRQLESLAWIDPLTGAGNRRLLEIELSQANRAAAGERMLPALAILDLDHFKQINDRFGHEAGDRVLVQFTDLLRDLMRKVDRLYRYGGEEFVLLLPAADASGLQALVDAVRASVESRLATPDGMAVTVSIGAALLRQGEHWSHWLGRADAALYRAKQAGRNRVEIDEERPRSQVPRARDAGDASGPVASAPRQADVRTSRDPRIGPS